MGNSTHEDIIKKYDEKLPKLIGKCSDTLVIAKVIYFNKYIKQMLPVIAVKLCLCLELQIIFINFHRIPPIKLIAIQFIV